MLELIHYAEQDETVLERCRNNFKLLEEGDEYCVSLCKELGELSLKEFGKEYMIYLELNLIVLRVNHFI